MPVEASPDHENMPLLIEPANDLEGSPTALASWLAGWRHALDDRLHDRGGVLLRGFGIGSPETFHDVVTAIEPRLLSYVGGDSPRKSVADRIYTSTEFPPELEIGLHNELSYTRSWPERLFFCSLVVADSGGETHIADGRNVLEQMEPAVRDRFAEQGVLYRQHLRDGDSESGPGKSWQETFETTDRNEVERICHDQGVEFSWTPRGLRTSLHNPGVVTHPSTGEDCWFNQADLWHASFDTVKDQQSVREAADNGEEPLGCHACYGDGTEIPIEDLQAVRSAYRRSEVVFPWRTGDLLILDNVIAMHGRKPFTGDRRVLVAMT